VAQNRLTRHLTHVRYTPSSDYVRTNSHHSDPASVQHGPSFEVLEAGYISGEQLIGILKERFNFTFPDEQDTPACRAPTVPISPEFKWLAGRVGQDYRNFSVVCYFRDAEFQLEHCLCLSRRKAREKECQNNS
jgi:hypothetical protein